MAKFIVVHSVKVATDFVPETFGRLTTIGPKFRLPVGNRGSHKFSQVCECSCGQLCIVNNGDLKNKTRSCGCLRRETATLSGKTKAIRGSGWVAGISEIPEYGVWAEMKRRCRNPNASGYCDYGGRGIRVCDRWLEPNGRGFVNFFEDMGPRPNSRLTIERKCVNEGYSPDNCQWATYTEQARNRRNNINLSHNGKTQCIAAWAEELGCTYGLICKRLSRGWPVEKALQTPPQQKTR